MSIMYVPALAAFGGSAFGAVSSIVSGWAAQRRKKRERHHLRSFSSRESLYRSFVEEASRLYADALVRNESEISELVRLHALIGRMRIVSSNDVVLAAERTGRLIIETYLAPNPTFAELAASLDKEIDPLRDFGEACRRELLSLSPR